MRDMPLNVPKTNAMRVLEANGVVYEVFTFPPHIRSAVEVAKILGVPPAHVYKTLVALRSVGKPMLVMIPGDCELDRKRLASAIGEKRVTIASQREAERLTGLQVGGISALALAGRNFEVFIDQAAVGLSHIWVSAGKRGVDLRIAVEDLIRVTGAQIVAGIAQRSGGQPATG